MVCIANHSVSKTCSGTGHTCTTELAFCVPPHHMPQTQVWSIEELSLFYHVQVRCLSIHVQLHLNHLELSIVQTL